MRTIGFIGLGVMGAPMASNLVKAGFDVAGHTRNPSGTDRLVANGGRRAESVAAATRGADVVITMLPDSPDVESVILGPDGVLAHAAPGTLVIDMSTVRPRTAQAIAAAAAERGVEALDAPVSGGEQGAIEGVLSIMVGGSPAAFDKARPVFEALGTTVVRVGPPGAGQLVKAANQLVVAGTLELVAEAIVLVEASGVDAEAALRVWSGGLAGSTVLDRKGAGMLARSFTPGFRVDLHHKDLGILLDAARAAGAAVPLGAVVAQLMGALRAQGDGGLDHGALLRGVERLSGRAPAATPPLAAPSGETPSDAGTARTEVRRPVVPQSAAGRNETPPEQSTARGNETSGEQSTAGGNETTHEQSPTGGSGTAGRGATDGRSGTTGAGAADGGTGTTGPGATGGGSGAVSAGGGSGAAGAGGSSEAAGAGGSSEAAGTGGSGAAGGAR